MIYLGYYLWCYFVSLNARFPTLRIHTLLYTVVNNMEKINDILRSNDEKIVLKDKQREVLLYLAQ